MKKLLLIARKLVCAIILIPVFYGCKGTPSAGNSAPLWVTNLERAYPSRDWVAVVAEGDNRGQAESSAMTALARIFKTDVESLTQASIQYIQIIDNSAGSKSIDFNQSRNYSQDVNTTANIKGLIGVEIDTYNRNDGTVFVSARMNRRECAARYTGMIRENSAIIERLVNASSPVRASFDIYARLSLAHSLALVTDNFQNILEVLDVTAVNRKPAYGTANAVKEKMLECSSLITIGAAVNTQAQDERILLTRAIGSFFRDLGFRINERGEGNYVLNVNARFEPISQSIYSCRYFLDAALLDSNQTAIFSFTEDDRKAHPNMPREARRLAVRAAEDSFKTGRFAQEFSIWLGGMIE